MTILTGNCAHLMSCKVKNRVGNLGIPSWWDRGLNLDVAKNDGMVRTKTNAI